MSLTILSTSGVVSVNASDEKASPDLYLEVSNTLTAQDTFAWTEYDHCNYKDYYLPTDTFIQWKQWHDTIVSSNW